MKNSKIEIWTQKKDIKKIKQSLNFKIMSKIIHVNFEEIDNLIKLKSEFTNKYEHLSFIQYGFITSHITKYKFLWFFYPDFIFSKYLINNCLKKLISKDIDLLLISVPQIKEQETRNIFKQKKIDEINITKTITNNLHEYVKLFEINKIKDYNFPFICGISNNSLVFKNFHLHPLVINSKNYLAYKNPFYPSLDAGVPEFFINKKTFIPKDDKFGVCASLANETLSGTYDLNDKNKSLNLVESILFALKNYNKCHLKFSKNNYFINKKHFKNKNKLFLINKKANIIKSKYFNFLDNLNSTNIASLKNYAKFKFCYSLFEEESLKFKYMKHWAVKLNQDLFSIFYKNEKTKKQKKIDYLKNKIKNKKLLNFYLKIINKKFIS